ncbi:hypothetical protein SARC_15156 [Sphaeroforma arctica JP610]|uniref:Uncharacterized protein n=1 Tax=Sphaeroforma arctica JP610 TaxID=667725 RepID=A0A0L0F6U5_9EUKA|nr:hypothetical protein SARC_15156 [Sphaeroforma arctica JP610]KNC72291.1 hypothetical protein SARC_15156 [Sphaeroforma arctica JP610]|eukprot:XP_014146193.1 hypothetical protein SARC_15156 [Sphaeroforma arctica JP610]
MHHQHQTLGLVVGHVSRILGPAHAPRCPKIQRAPTSTNTGSHTPHGGAPPHRASAVGTSTRTQQVSGNNFRPRVSLVDGDDQMPDSTPAEVGESEVMHIHDLVDESYVDSEDKLVEAAQGPADWEERQVQIEMLGCLS